VSCHRSDGTCLLVCSLVNVAARLAEENAKQARRLQLQDALAKKEKEMADLQKSIAATLNPQKKRFDQQKLDKAAQERDALSAQLQALTS